MKIDLATGGNLGTKVNKVPWGRLQSLSGCKKRGRATDIRGLNSFLVNTELLLSEYYAPQTCWYVQLPPKPGCLGPAESPMRFADQACRFVVSTLLYGVDLWPHNEMRTTSVLPLFPNHANSGCYPPPTRPGADSARQVSVFGSRKPGEGSHQESRRTRRRLRQTAFGTTSGKTRRLGGWLIFQEANSAPIIT